MNSAKNDNLEPGLGTPNFEMIIRFSKFRENFRLQFGSQTLKTLPLRFEFCCTPCQKVIIVPDTDYVTSAIRKLMHVGYTTVLVASKIWAFHQMLIKILKKL